MGPKWFKQILTNLDRSWQILMDTDTDTGDRHIPQIKFAPSYVITYYKIPNQQKAIADRE